MVDSNVLMGNNNVMSNNNVLGDNKKANIMFWATISLRNAYFRSLSDIIKLSEIERGVMRPTGLAVKCMRYQSYLTFLLCMLGMSDKRLFSPNCDVLTLFKFPSKAPYDNFR